MNRWPAMLKWPMRAHNVVETTLRHTLTTGGLGRGGNAALNLVRLIDLIQPVASILFVLGVLTQKHLKVFCFFFSERKNKALLVYQ